MAELSSIETQIRDITGLKPKAKELRNAFLTRLTVGMQKLPDDKWDDLPKNVQDWANAAQTAHNDKKDMPDFDGEVAEAAEAEADDEEEKKPVKKGKAVPPKKAAKSNGKRKAADDDEDNGNGDRPVTGMKADIKRMIIKNPKWKTEDIMAALTKKGTTPSRFTVASIGSEFRHTLRVLKAEGLIDIPGH